MICVKRRLSAISSQQQEAISAQPSALSLRQEAISAQPSAVSQRRTTHKLNADSWLLKANSLTADS